MLTFSSHQWTKPYHSFIALPDDDPPIDPGGPELCTYGSAKESQALDLAPTKLCGLSQYGKYGIPGGAVCEGAENLARCPRPWQ